ncbi:MAG: TetR/AcrR family transcriptional repressor of nem operon [Flavobacteriaceae bacterium]|uniref:TetR/AcrR family transcriptional regulator n=1 Tax=Candidatus Marifrigoribacter sp. Uisw_064 TaxID=3230970 RepID=UPI003AE85659
MISKSEKTTRFIIEKVAPLFNQKGYAATSMSDITKATGLTKGAIYGNFKNKEAVAIAAFNKNVNDLLKRIAKHQEQSKSPLEKLFLIIDFYKGYYDYSQELGGCPLLNIGVDAKNQNTSLLNQVRYVINKTQNNIAKLVEWGKAEGEIKNNVDAVLFSKNLYSRIEGAIFMTYTMDDDSYLQEAMNEIDELIKKDLQV